MVKKARVLFLCTHNSARSQMAEGLLRHLGEERFEVHSAGTKKTSVRQEAVRAMAEIGVDISEQKSKTLERYLDQPFDYVITVCDSANEACPVFPGAKNRLHWSFEDPSGATGTERMRTFRKVRDGIRTRIEEELLDGAPTPNVGPAGEDDFADILTLLEACGLPPDGLEDHLATTLVVRADGRIVGNAALEIYGSDALLRSVAVSRDFRGTGLGERLVRAALDLARERGVENVYLLTETAADYFPHFGFRPIERADVPEDVRGSVEFVSACPESAQAMVLNRGE